MRIENIKRKVLEGAYGPAWAVEGGELMLYWTAPGFDPESFDRLRDTRAFKQAFDPVSQSLVGETIEVTELGVGVAALDISPNGKWLAFSCVPQDRGSSILPESEIMGTCLAERASPTAAWGDIRLLSPVTRQSHSAFAPGLLGNAAGDPVALYYRSFDNGSANQDSAICRSALDVDSGSLSPCEYDRLYPHCGLLEPVTRDEFYISAFCSLSLDPAWSPDGQYFAWTFEQQGFYFHVLIGRSSRRDGLVDSLLGVVEPNGDLQQVGFSFAPDGPDGMYKGIVAWNEGTAVQVPSLDLSLNVGRFVEPEQ